MKIVHCIGNNVLGDKVLSYIFFLCFSFVSLGVWGEVNAQNSVNLQESSHVFLIRESQKILDRNFLLFHSLRYLYAKNFFASNLYSDVYFLEEKNRLFMEKTLELEQNKNFSRVLQYMGALRDFETFAKRDIIKELEIVGDDYKKREDYISHYIHLGTILKKSSQDFLLYFSATNKTLSAEISDLRSQRKALLKSYEQLITDGNGKKSEEVGKQIRDISLQLGEKELAQIRYKIFLKKDKRDNTIITEKVNAVLENKDALIKNVKVKRKSGEYIKIIEE